MPPSQIRIQIPQMFLQVLKRFTLGHVIGVFLQITDPKLSILPVNVPNSIHAPKLYPVPLCGQRPVFLTAVQTVRIEAPPVTRRADGEAVRSPSRSGPKPHLRARGWKHSGSNPAGSLADQPHPPSAAACRFAIADQQPERPSSTSVVRTQATGPPRPGSAFCPSDWELTDPKALQGSP